ncbi:phage GP46 family protein [Acidocella sp.]|uniref:phage GP46 family protein n=1 Tax=Acidocella sp. TaxID=50710 RepID=UPI002630F5E6|nr:phage GP46 family protein [Acidocella sp.]MDD2794355.1 phage GP46 family protein [Acidocella sp.]
MTGIALTWSNTLLCADISTAWGDIAIDAGLQTAVIISLLSDREAAPGDVLPDDNGPRGWWGDAYLGFKLGSRLWLLRRTVLTQKTLNLAQDYAMEALQWMIDFGIAGSVSVVATATGLHTMNLAVTINQTGGSAVFNVLWQGQAVAA